MTEERVKTMHFRQEFAYMAETAMTRPVVVTNYNMPNVVLISYDEFKRFRQFMYRMAGQDSPLP